MSITHLLSRLTGAEQETGGAMEEAHGLALIAIAERLDVLAKPQRRVAEYATLLDTQPQELDTEIDQHLALGWELYGNQYVITRIWDGEQTDWYHQVVVRREGAEPRQPITNQAEPSNNDEVLF